MGSDHSSTCLKTFDLIDPRLGYRRMASVQSLIQRSRDSVILFGSSLVGFSGITRNLRKVSSNFAFSFTGKTNICIGMSSWKGGESMKSMNSSANWRFLVPFNNPTYSIWRKQQPSAVIASVGGALEGSSEKSTSKEGKKGGTVYTFDGSIPKRYKRYSQNGTRV